MARKLGHMDIIMDKKQFEKSARTLLKYGVASSIEEAREKLQLMIDVKKIVERNKLERKKGVKKGNETG